MKKQHSVNGVGFYFRGRISDIDDRQCVVAAHISKKPVNGNRVQALNISVDGEPVIDYKAERDASAAGEIDGIYRSWLDGSFWAKYKPLALKENYSHLN